MTSPFVGNRTALCNWRSAVRRAALRILQPLVERERHPPLTATTGYGVAPTAAIKAGFVLSTTNSRSIRRSPARQGHTVRVAPAPSPDARDRLASASQHPAKALVFYTED